MGSANILRAKSFERQPAPASTARLWRSAALFALVLALFGSISAFGRSGNWSRAIAVFSVVAACFLWMVHLLVNRLRCGWSYLLAALLGCQLVAPIMDFPMIPGSAWLSALGCALFVYAMIWISAAHECDPGLQPLAALALLLSIGVLAKPAVAISCTLLSSLLFFRSRQRFGGMVSAALLLFTPAALCLIAFAILSFLATGTVQGAIVSALRTSETQTNAVSDLSSLMQISDALWFAFFVLMSRFFESKIGLPDFAYILLLAFLSTAGMASWIPNALTPMDVRMVAYAGAACLFALRPPQKTIRMAAVLAGVTIPLLGGLHL